MAGLLPRNLVCKSFPDNLNQRGQESGFFYMHSLPRFSSHRENAIFFKGHGPK